MVNIASIRPLLDGIKNPILGLDAYGVIYNGHGFFEWIDPVFDYCNRKQIPIYLMTNNATQSVAVIANNLQKAGLAIPNNQIISSGCGLETLPKYRQLIYNQPVFVYGYESAKSYVTHAGGHCVNAPQDAQVIVLAAALQNDNHLVYLNTVSYLLKHPHIPVICINPDHYVATNHGLMRVMGYYAHQMAVQLNRSNFGWVGKPHRTFSDLVSAQIAPHTGSQLLFCDDNPCNVHRMVTDLGCMGAIITQTGVYARYQHLDSHHPNIVRMPRCCL